MDQETTSYKQIAKSTGIFGGSQVITILSGLVRTKVLAILLGTTGVGLSGMFQSIIDLIRSITSLGLSFSSVRDISEAHQSDDPIRVGGTVTMLKRWLWWTGLGGMVLTIALSPFISRWTFGNESQTLSICLLSFCVFTGTISTGQIAILQGMRKIGYMAKVSAWGAVLGLTVALALYAWLGIEGIVPTLVALSVMSLLISWWFARKIPIEKVAQTYRETFARGGSMVKLGLFTVGSGLVSTLTMFLLRSYILQNGRVEDVGLFQAAWSITNMYLGAVLTAMSADYYPRLCSLNEKNNRMVEFVNQQTRFVLVVSTPLIVGMMLMTTSVIHLLFSSEFVTVNLLLRWQILGTFFKVLIWPAGFVLLAKGKGFRFLLVEVVWYVSYLLSTVLLWPSMGLNAAGLSFVIAYLIYLPLVFTMVKPLCGLRFDGRNVYLIVQFLLFVVASFLVVFFLNGWVLAASGLLLFALSITVSGIEFNRFLPVKEWLPKIRKILRR